MKEEILKRHLGGSMPSPEVLKWVFAAMEEYADLRVAENGVSTLDYDRMMKMKNDGTSIVAIAKFFGVSRQTVYNHLRKSPVQRMEEAGSIRKTAEFDDGGAAYEVLDAEIEKSDASHHTDNDGASDELPS